MKFFFQGSFPLPYDPETPGVWRHDTLVVTAEAQDSSAALAIMKKQLKTWLNEIQESNLSEGSVSIEQHLTKPIHL